MLMHLKTVTTITTTFTSAPTFTLIQWCWIVWREVLLHRWLVRSQPLTTAQNSFSFNAHVDFCILGVLLSPCLDILLDYLAHIATMKLVVIVDKLPPGRHVILNNGYQPKRGATCGLWVFGELGPVQSCPRQLGPTVWYEQARKSSEDTQVAGYTQLEKVWAG